jgi:MFS transporter, ACS family, 4-hydroxyphenylacetate permease
LLSRRPRVSKVAGNELDAAEGAVARKVYRHLTWFLVLLFVASYLDRINMSFAALSMNADLGLSATMFGLANAIFYAAYVLAEIPSNMMMPRFGAKIWLPRIMITWGVASSATMLAHGPTSLYILRALVGLAEAGFMPGILLYMTYWFPASYRARASTLFIMAQPITILFGSSISGLVLHMDGLLGLAGWRWLFLLEGVPSIVLGVAAFFYLSNKPQDAKWLSDNEKRILLAALDRSNAGPSGPGNTAAPSLTRELLGAPVILLALAYLGLVASLSANSTWVPQIVRSIAPGTSFIVIGLIAALPSLVAIIAMSVWGAHSDRRRERFVHVICPMFAAALGWLTVALAPTPAMKFVGLLLCSAGAFSAQAIFWTLPASYLSARARPAGIALINTAGMLGTSISPIVIGVLKDVTGGFSAGLIFVAASVIAGAFCIFALSRRSSYRLAQKYR